MIDFVLVETGKQILSGSLEQTEKICDPYLFAVKNCLPESCLQKIKQYVTGEPLSAWQSVSGQESLNRKALTWQADSIVEELHMICESATGQICRKFKTPLNFHGIQIWQDGPGYHIAEHTDNLDINVSLQIYLFGVSTDVGTSFRLPDGRWHEICFETNNGYLLLNDHRCLIAHKSTSQVPDNSLRYSVYAVWGKRPKRQ